MKNEEIIAVVRAHSEGKQIQFRPVGADCGWADTKPSWDFSRYDYRVKSEPREWWINTYPDRADYAFRNKEHAATPSAIENRIECVHVREVLG